jgi:hypothetical protein
MADESVLGLLLRAHAKCSAQAHGEEYVFHNVSAAQHWEQAATNIAAAIRSVGFAEQYAARQGDRKVSK